MRMVLNRGLVFVWGMMTHGLLPALIHVRDSEEVEDWDVDSDVGELW